MLLKQSFPNKHNNRNDQSNDTLSAPSEQAVHKKRELEVIAKETLRQVIDMMDDTFFLDKMDTIQKDHFLRQINHTVDVVLTEFDKHLSQSDKHKIVKDLSDEILGFGPINPLIHDPTVTEIMVNGYDQIFVERDGKITKTDVCFRDNAHVIHTIDKIITPLGRRIDESSPMVDARLPDGSRVNAIIPPLAVKGPILTIRKFAADPFTSEDLISFGTMTREVAQFLRASVRARVNILVSGGTGSGKTTTLNVLSSFIPDMERIVTIEDAAELQLRQEHVVTLESRPANIEGKGQITIRDLVINSLRMRPDRIVIGEVRGGEALDMLQAMNTGHDGSISTLHANNPRDALARLETMVLMAGMDLPLRAIREQVSSAVDLIIQQSRLNDGSRKIVKVAEVVGMEGDIITMQDIFVYNQTGVDDKGLITGKHTPTGIIPKCIEKMKEYGERINIEIFEEKFNEPSPRRF
ncbi:MAG: CpaF family protein [Bacillota bacterium]|nr:CpaF family protein [Bacillota bacterium]